MIAVHIAYDDEDNRSARALGMDLSCPTELADHIAAIEAGWTLPKPWKVTDERRVMDDNRQAIVDMLDRWRAHGIEIR